MQGSLDQYTIGILCALAATVFFGITNVVYKKIDNEISVIDIVVTRIWVSLPISYVFAVGSAGTVNFTIPAEALFPLAVSMILGIVIGDTLYFFSQERIGVGRAFPIVMSYPLVVYTMAAIFLGEPVIIQRVLGAVIVVVGVSLIARAEYSEDTKNSIRWKPRDRNIGLLLAFITIVVWSASDVIFQYGLIGVGAAEANYYRMVIASIVYIPIFVFSLKGGRRLPSRRISSIAMIAGFFSIGLSLIVYSYAVKFVGATITSVMIASAPVITAPLSALYLREDVNKNVGIGTILTILGVLLVVVIL
ncbi:EamA family transporter [Candidatus Thorarchaeota archaeon]|nr:MAG: EamA family transporter [Candidatus Thorarchaeota archaeon]